LAMTEGQKVQRMEVISQSPEFLPEVSRYAKDSALNFLKANVNSIPNMSLRSLIQVSKIANKGGEWKDLAKYVLTQGA